SRKSWPTLATPPIVGSDIFLSYFPEDKMSFLAPRESSKSLKSTNLLAPHPEGMSGGGVWREGLTTSSIWQPNATLHAIQCSCCDDLRDRMAATPRREGWLRATLISKWLEIVKENYPDLANILHFVP